MRSARGPRRERRALHAGTRRGRPVACTTRRRKRWVPEPRARRDIPGDVQQRALPFYDRVDVSVTRNGHVRGATFAPYLSVVNLLNAHNPAAYIYDYKVGRSGSRFRIFPFVADVRSEHCVLGIFNAAPPRSLRPRRVRRPALGRGGRERRHRSVCTMRERPINYVIVQRRTEP